MDANENVTAQAAAGTDVTAAGETNDGVESDTEAEVVADGENLRALLPRSCTPEGLHIFFLPYLIFYYAAGEPGVVVKYVDYPHIFNESYVAADAYVTFDSPQSTFSRFDYDNDGTMNSVRIFSQYLQGEGSAATHQKFTTYLDEAEALELGGILHACL